MSIEKNYFFFNFRADKDKNKKLDSKELAQWIRMKIVEHITMAVSNNYGLFTLIDVNPKNGVVTWNEYHAYFLKKRGFNSKYVGKHDEKRHKGLQRSLKGMEVYQHYSKFTLMILFS